MVDAPTAGSEENAADAFLQGGPSLRNASGPYFGSYGGRWMPESLIAALDEVQDTFEKAKADPEFIAQLKDLNKNYSGRPSLLTEAKRFSEHAGGERVFSSSARTSTTLAPTRSTTCWARHSSRSAWARPALSPRPVPVSMALRVRRQQPAGPRVRCVHGC